MNLVLAFHDPNFIPIFFLMMFVGMPLIFFVVVRAIYIALLRPSKRMLKYAGGILGVCLAIWPVAYWSSSMMMEIGMIATTFPFGMFLGSLHGDLWYFIPRDMLLGGLNAAYHPITPHIFVERAIINAATVVWVIDFWERRWPSQEGQPGGNNTADRRSEFAAPTTL